MEINEYKCKYVISKSHNVTGDKYALPNTVMKNFIPHSKAVLFYFPNGNINEFASSSGDRYRILNGKNRSVFRLYRFEVGKAEIRGRYTQLYSLYIIPRFETGH